MIQITCINVSPITKSETVPPFIVPIIYNATHLQLDVIYFAEDSMRVNTYGEPTYYIPSLGQEYLAERFLNPLEINQQEKHLEKLTSSEY